MDKKVILMILDGWGISPNPEISAVERANTPFIDSLYKKYPHSTLQTEGMNVGLPKGQMGNSEVGHMNIGAGRVVYQDLTKINLAVENKTLKEEETLIKGLQYARDNKKKVHLLGLLSDGGVHSHISHLKGIIEVIESMGLEDVYIHAFTDGRDVDPRSAKGFVKDLNIFLEYKKSKIATLIGRYYAMDRDKRWERVKKAYNLLTKLEADVVTDNLEQALDESYDQDITDEFINPIATKDAQPIKEDDVVVFFNFRTDRGRQLTQALSQHCGLEDKGMNPLNLYYITLTCYDDSFEGIHVIYDKENISETLGEVISKAGMRQIRIAETEKYPHVTFFFNGGLENAFEGEKRILCPSPKVATYDLKPQMSAFDIVDVIVPELEKGEADFICLNFANPDMVGHTGNMDAAIKACETVDVCTKEVLKAAEKGGYVAVIIADHGNCDTMKNPDGSPNTAHTTNPVPVILVDKSIKEIKKGVLADIAPTILKLMNLNKPKLMTGQELI